VSLSVLIIYFNATLYIKAIIVLLKINLAIAIFNRFKHLKSNIYTSLFKVSKVFAFILSYCNNKQMLI
jgi:hypothetical protein